MRLWVELCSRCGGGEGHNSQGGGDGGLHTIASKRRKKRQQQQQQSQASPEPLSAKAASTSTSSCSANHIQSERYLAVSMLAVRRLARQGGGRGRGGVSRGLRGFCYDDNTGDIRSFFHFFVDAMLERERIFAQSRCHFTSSGTFLCGVASARAPPPSPWQWQVRCRPVVVVLQPPIRRKRYNEEEAKEDGHHLGLTTSRLQSTHFALRRGVRFRSKTSPTRLKCTNHT